MITTTNKVLIWIAAILIMLITVIYFADEIRVWFMGKLTYLIILAIVFCVGWLLGRFGSRRRSREEENISEITKAQSGKK